MTRPTIFVTGATGKTGAAVVAQLREKGWPVRAIVRSRDARSDRLDRLGAETVVADIYDTEQLVKAMRGTARAYYVPHVSPYMIQSATAFAIATREAKLESIVQMSQWISNPAHPALATRQVWLVDQLFSMIPGVAHTIVNPGMFADNFLRTIDFAALLGIHPVLTGTSKSAPVSNEDIARVVVAVLTDPASHAGKRYRPTGPKLLSGDDIAAILEKVLGNRVRAVPMPAWLFRKVARMQGVHPFELSGYRYYLEDHKRGVFEFEGGTNEVVREVTGQPAEDFETTARRYAALPFANKTFANRLRAFFNFGLVPFHPGYDLDRYDREHEFPMPLQPNLSIDDQRWRTEHSVLRSYPLAVAGR
jgi:uncharacterized protein YbjT (DUF2867 family)